MKDIDVPDLRECDKETLVRLLKELPVERWNEAYKRARSASAYLWSANLRYADLWSANLGSANLRYADLGSANLRSANLRSADLGSANLGSANLGYANLGYAYLGYAYLGSANQLDQFRIDMWAVLDELPGEVARLRVAMLEGKIDGSQYAGECACLCGTLDPHETVTGIRNASRPSEQWFMPIHPETTPRIFDDVDALLAVTDWKDEGEFRASWALYWLDAWTARNERIAGALT